MNHAGKGDTPRKVIGSIYRENYEAIFRELSNADIVHKSEFADIDSDPFESPDHDNDCDMYAEKI